MASGQGGFPIGFGNSHPPDQGKDLYRKYVLYYYRKHRVSAFWALSLKSPILASSFTFLDYFSSPMSEHKLGGSIGNFVCWPLKRVPEFSAVTSWQTSSCCFAQPDIFWVLFSVLVLISGEPSLGTRSQSYQWHLPTTEISLRDFSCCLWVASQPSLASKHLTSFYAISSFGLQVAGFFPSSFTLINHELFLYFSCNYILFLGACPYVSTYSAAIFNP